MEFLNPYINMFKNYVNFKDRTNVRGYWMAFLCNIIVFVILGILMAISAKLSFLYYIYSLAVLIPNLAIIVRRLRDSGREWYFIFLSLIPCVGGIILLVFLTKPSVADDGTPVV